MELFILGDKNVGKNSLFQYFSTRVCPSTKSPKIRFNFRTRHSIVNDELITIRIYTTHAIKTANLHHINLHLASGILLVYDITDIRSFYNIVEWIYHIRTSVNVPIVIVGNKNDLGQAHQRKISFDEGKNVADELGCKFFESSTQKKMQRVTRIFNQLFDDMILTRDECRRLSLDHNNKVQNLYAENSTHYNKIRRLGSGLIHTITDVIARCVNIFRKYLV